MEASAGAHYWAREIERLGHTVRLMSPHFVAPYRKSQKNDDNDADAICEAVGRPSMRFVPAKSAAQQDIQALHRIRFQLIKWRTALANEIRGLLAEYGIVIAKGVASLRHKLALILADEENQLSSFFREMLGEMAERLNLLDRRIRDYDFKLRAFLVAMNAVSVRQVQSHLFLSVPLERIANGDNEGVRLIGRICEHSLHRSFHDIICQNDGSRIRGLMSEPIREASAIVAGQST
jgi:transposase